MVSRPGKNYTPNPWREAEPGMWYAVVVIGRGTVTYCGRSEGRAADLLLLGTCFGKGPNREAAIEQAHAIAERLRRARRVRGDV